MTAKPDNKAIRTVAVLLAGGSGVRSGLDYPKQFLRLGGRAVIEHTLDVFQDEDLIDEIIIVLPAMFIESTRQLVEESRATKVTALIEGGRTRNESTAKALAHLADRSEAKLVIHDAVRPLLPHSVLRECITTLDVYDAADVVISTSDTIVEIEDGVVVGIPERARLRRGQTPQAFKLSVLARAYEAVTQEQLSHFTDDAAVVLATMPDVRIKAINGSEENLKITHVSDIYLADRLLQGRQSTLSAHEPALDISKSVVVVIGGTSGIGAAIVDDVTTAGGTAVALSRSEGNVDVRSSESVGKAFHAIVHRHGRIDAIVNTSGVMSRRHLLELDDVDIETEIDTNLLGAINVARAAHPYLSLTRGHLMFFTSSSYTRGRASYGVYSATKAGIVNLSQALAEEWRADHIKVNCINPGRTDTPMRRRAFGSEPAGTLLDVEEVSSRSLEVLASSMTGHVFDVRSEHVSRDRRRP